MSKFNEMSIFKFIISIKTNHISLKLPKYYNFIKYFYKSSLKKMNNTKYIYNIIPSTLLLKSAYSMTMVENKKSNEEIEYMFSNLLLLVQKALEEGDLERAEALINSGIVMAEDNKLYSILAVMYNILSNLTLIQGDIKKVELLLQTIMQKLLNAGMAKDDDSIITFKLKLSRLYGSTGNNEQAEINFKECIKMQEHKMKNHSFSERTGILYIDCLFWYGIFLMDNGRYREAEDNIERAYQFTSKTGGIGSAQEMVILTILAEIACALGNYDKAIQKMQNVIVIAKNIMHPELAMSNVLLGMIYLKKEMYQKAREWCEEGYRLSKADRNSEAYIQGKLCLRRIEEHNKNNPVN